VRTTVVLPPELLRAAKVRASQQGETLKELITRAVDREVAERPRSGNRKLVLPLIGRADDPNTVDVTNADIHSALEADDTERYGS